MRGPSYQAGADITPLPNIASDVVRSPYRASLRGSKVGCPQRQESSCSTPVDKAHDLQARIE
jgi:hypothetical protein